MFHDHRIFQPVIAVNQSISNGLPDGELREIFDLQLLAVWQGQFLPSLIHVSTM